MVVQQYPRSPKALLGGIAHLGRFIDKIRLRNEGKIQDYNYVTVGFDKYLVDFLRIDPKAFELRVLGGGTDEELLAWVVAHGKPLTQEMIEQWSKDLLAQAQKMKPLANGFRDVSKTSRPSVACLLVPSLLSLPGPM